MRLEFFVVFPCSFSVYGIGTGSHLPFLDMVSCVVSHVFLGQPSWQFINFTDLFKELVCVQISPFLFRTLFISAIFVILKFLPSGFNLFFSPFFYIPQICYIELSFLFSSNIVITLETSSLPHWLFRSKYFFAL